jgi:hypothetical protein
MINIKKLVLIIAILLIFITQIYIAYADVIWEPDNRFYEQNRDDAILISRFFYANGDKGYVSLKSQPGSGSEVARYNNGELLYIQFACDYKGKIWGVDYTPGWVPMDQLLLRYDYISFEEEYGDEFYSYEGNYDMLEKTDVIVFWNWPGSGSIIDVRDLSVSYSSDERTWLQPSNAYRDSEGREWGFITYFYGTRNFWICMSDLSNTEIPAFNPAPEPVLWQPADMGGAQRDIPLPVLVIILVAALAATTIITIRAF